MWNCLGPQDSCLILIKSPRYTGDDFMFLYWFVRHRRQPPSLVHAITSEQLFRFISFLAGLMDLTCRLPIRFWLIFVVTLTLNFQGQIWNLLYLGQKWSNCHETKSKHIDWTLSFKSDWPWPWPWPWIFKVQFAISRPKMFWLARNKKHIDWTLSLKCDHWIWPWPWPWPWIFKVKYGIHYILAKDGPIATKQ